MCSLNCARVKYICMILGIDQDLLLTVQTSFVYRSGTKAGSARNFRFPWEFSSLCGQTAYEIYLRHS